MVGVANVWEDGGRPLLTRSWRQTTTTTAGDGGGGQSRLPRAIRDGGHRYPRARPSRGTGGEGTVGGREEVRAGVWGRQGGAPRRVADRGCERGATPLDGRVAGGGPLPWRSNTAAVGGSLASYGRVAPPPRRLRGSRGRRRHGRGGGSPLSHTPPVDPKHQASGRGGAGAGMHHAVSASNTHTPTPLSDPACQSRTPIVGRFVVCRTTGGRGGTGATEPAEP